MDNKKIYRITDGEYTPPGRWDDRPELLMDYKHVANTIAKKIHEMDDQQFVAFLQSSMTIWGTMLEVVTVRAGRVEYDRDLEPMEGKYIATAIANTIRDRRARMAQ